MQGGEVAGRGANPNPAGEDARDYSRIIAPRHQWPRPLASVARRQGREARR